MRNLDSIITLAIDTSCDETSVAVVKGRTVLSSIMPSQMEYHKKFGGVVPSLAKLAHAQRIDNVVDQALKKASVSLSELNTVSVTYGPGLAIALEVGLKKAKQLSQESGKPLIAVNHMEGHLVSALALPNSQQSTDKNFEFPSIGFLISGGHTEIIYVEDFGKYKKIGETVDDSCGEAYDKCGRILGFGYPAGPVITKFAEENRHNYKLSIVKDNLSVKIQSENIRTGKVYELPVAMVNSGNLNMSYSGLKTAFKQLATSLSGNTLSHEQEIQGDKGLTKEQVIDLCVLFEAAAIEQLKVKLRKALKEYPSKQLWLGGGVIASARLRTELRSVAREFKTKTLYPYTKKLTGDNAAMIGLAANIKVAKIGLENLKHNPEILIYTQDFDSLDREPSLSL